MKMRIPFWIICFLVSTGPLVHAESADLKILCLGDSLTQGRGVKPGVIPTRSYRYALWKKLVDHGVSFDLVGSLRMGFEGDPEYPDYKGQTFDRDHEGHWGWRVDDILKPLPDWMKNYEVDIALVLLGTNDLSQKQSVESTIEEMRSLTGELRKKNPKIIVIFGQCLPEWSPFPEYRKALADLAKTLNQSSSPVKIADASAQWVSDPARPGSLTVDWIHPNDAGDATLASAFAKALEPFLKKEK